MQLLLKLIAVLLWCLLAGDIITAAAAAAGGSSSSGSSSDDGRNTCRNPDDSTCKKQGGSDRHRYSSEEQEPQQEPQPRPRSDSPTCSLYLSESAVHSGYLGLFSGRDRPAGENLVGVVGTSSSPGNDGVGGDPFVPVLDRNKNEWSPLDDYLWPPSSSVGLQQMWMESHFINDVFVPGIASLIACSNRYSNVISNRDARYDSSAGAHRSSKSATAGSFAYYHNSAYSTSRKVKAGEELVLSCEGTGFDDAATAGRQVLDLEFLKQAAVCLEDLVVKPSTVVVGEGDEGDDEGDEGDDEGAAVGRGAFASRSYRAGDVVATSPVVHFDRSQLEIQQQEYPNDFGMEVLGIQRDHGIRYNATAPLKGRQLLTNYCYGHKDSDVLLLPLAPGVNFINHDSDKANAYVRWSRHERARAVEMKRTRPMGLFSMPALDRSDEWLAIEFVASRPIAEGEEILIDYGHDWQEAWEAHRAEWKPDATASGYQSAADYIQSVAAELESDSDDEEEADDETIMLSLLRTLEEQEDDPYPENILTACFFTPQNGDLDVDVVEWSDAQHRGGCLRPCDILSRFEEEEDDEEEDVVAAKQYYYSVTVYESENVALPEDCGVVPPEGIQVDGVPPGVIQIVDAPYTSDLHLQGAFRHEIGMPDDFMPKAWLRDEPDPEGDFIPTPLGPGEVDRIYWRETGEVVTPWALRMGLTDRVRKVLLDYCDLLGITEVMRYVTIEGNGLQPGEEAYVNLDEHEWYLQRPDKNWHSNLHWFSPAGGPAHENYLQALSHAGFDDMLKALGEHLNMDGLVAFHVTFIAVSEATKGYIHQDVGGTQAKTYNMIIPLLLATETAPELDIQDANAPDDDRSWVGRYRYQYDVAALMGDNAYHGTSAVDYRRKKEMRLAATVYVADVNENNVDRIQEDYTQAYPPRDRDLLMSWAGTHWNRNDETARLPKPGRNHILVRGGGQQEKATLKNATGPNEHGVTPEERSEVGSEEAKSTTTDTASA